MATTHQAPTRGRWFAPRRKRVAAVLLALAAVAIPAAWASDRFTDVPDSHLAHDEISTIARAGITRGCSPTRFCPDDPVTRQAMALFLARTLRAQTPAFRIGGINSGFVDPDANQLVCGTLALSPAVTATAVVQGYVNLKQAEAGELGYRVIPTVSDDGGVTWNDLPPMFHVFGTTFASGAWSTAVLSFTLPQIEADSPRRLALRVARESGTADASDRRCRIWLTLHYADAGPPMLDD